MISDLIGIRPAIDPMVPWDWFRLKNVPFRGHLLTVSWDKKVFIDGKLASRQASFRKLVLDLKECMNNTCLALPAFS